MARAPAPVVVFLALAGISSSGCLGSNGACNYDSAFLYPESDSGEELLEIGALENSSLRSAFSNATFLLVGQILNTTGREEYDLLLRADSNNTWGLYSNNFRRGGPRALAPNLVPGRQYTFEISLRINSSDPSIGNRTFFGQANMVRGFFQISLDTHSFLARSDDFAIAGQGGAFTVAGALRFELLPSGICP